MTSKAVATIFIDNERTRVTEWRFAPGAATGWHRHEYCYVVVPIMNGRLRIVAPDGRESFSELVLGKPYYRELGVEHEVVNDNDFEFAFIETEFK